jgi:hypothetical protein
MQVTVGGIKVTEVMYCRSTLTRAAAVICLFLPLFPLPCRSGERQPARLTGADPPWNRNLRVLYAGRPGSDRERDFVGFLKQYFDVIQTGNLETFKEVDTPGFDVTLLDWDASDSTEDFQGPKPVLSESFSRPLITLGIPGSWLCSHWRLKTGYG